MKIAETKIYCDLVNIKIKLITVLIYDSIYKNIVYVL